MQYEVSTWFPLRLKNLKNLEKLQTIFESEKGQGILLGLEKSGNITQNTRKIRKKNDWKIYINTGNVWEICKPLIVKTLPIWYHTLNKKEL